MVNFSIVLCTVYLQKSSFEASQGSETARLDQCKSGEGQVSEVVFHHLPKMEDNFKFLFCTYLGFIEADLGVMGEDFGAMEDDVGIIKHDLRTEICVQISNWAASVQILNLFRYQYISIYSSNILMIYRT